MIKIIGRVGQFLDVFSFGPLFLCSYSLLRILSITTKGYRYPLPTVVSSDSTFQLLGNFKNARGITSCIHNQHPLPQEESSVHLRCLNILRCFSSVLFFPMCSRYFTFLIFLLIKVRTSSHLKLWFCPPSYECHCEDSSRSVFVKRDFSFSILDLYVDNFQKENISVVVYDYLTSGKAVAFV